MANLKYPQSPWFGRHQTGRNHLSGKVVLLVGHDAAALHSLAEPLARKGADIAVLAPDVPPQLVRPMRDSVESAGRRFLNVADQPQTTANGHAPRTIVEAVTASMGRLDIFIDLSAQAANRLAVNGGRDYDYDTEERHADWPLVHAALEQITGAGPA